MSRVAAWRTVGAALFLGLLGETLFYDAPWGLNVLLWTAFLVGVSVVTAIGSGGTPSKALVALSVSSLVFGAGFVVNDSWGMSVVNVLGLGTSLALLTTHVWGKRLRDMNVLDASVGVMTTWLGYFVDAMILLFSELGWTDLARKINVKRSAPVVRGLLIAVPMLVVFGGLFASADAVFRSFVFRPVTFDPTLGLTHFGLFLAFFVLGAGVVRRSVLGEPAADCTIKPTAMEEHKYATEALIVLGALNTLFAAFVAVQFGHLFGGRSALQTHAGLSYSDYAREGFFQLVAVVALSVPVLYGVGKLAAGKVLARWLSLAMVVQLGVVMASAFLRMGLYVSFAGLSELRLYPSAFMVWLATVIVAVTFRPLFGREVRPVPLSVASALIIGAALNVLRPGAFIAETNLRLAKDPASVDTEYLMSLGADAAPTVAKIFPSLKGEQREFAAIWLSGLVEKTHHDWRGYNVGRSQALAAVGAQEDEVFRSARRTTVSQSQP